MARRRREPDTRGQTWLLCPAASGRSVPPKRDGDRMGMRSSGGLLERPRQAQVEVHRRREVRLKVLVGWGARLDRQWGTSSPGAPCAQGGPSCAPTMEAFWSAECPERYRLTAVMSAWWLAFGALEWDDEWDGIVFRVALMSHWPRAEMYCHSPFKNSERMCPATIRSTTGARAQGRLR